jgi:hypothetical protein
MKRVFLLIFGVLISIHSVTAQEGLTSNRDPEKAAIVTSDIDLFWRAYDLAKPENNLVVYRDEYLKKGSVGLNEFVARKIGNSCNLVSAIDAAPKYYASLRAQSRRIEKYKPQMLASFRKLKQLYPEAAFPNVYFVVGRMNAGGTATLKGLLVGIEMYGKTDDASVAELTGWKKSSISGIDRIPHIVAHELVHYQQKNAHLITLYGGEVSLLGKALGEGSADFIGKLISGDSENPHLHVYGDPREKQLWAEFRKEMNGTDASNWLYQGDKAKDRPADLGYYIGFKIVEAYYNRAKDKKQAVKDILEIKDFDAFLKASGYDDKFANH